ncbi:hypothetical protein [Aquimarina spongiae]|uniref:Uncharacterized protein n=1 Tax=Aquimarina spongiae TaxID=570521 RepID=A0A1M6GHM8_9FLAO|nr:hypothetical protein [Aquimarina spongiae]SHJ09449.1 hypothetical protein SAMN04488508_105285 [Aquimarina spongiae]
MIIRTDYNEQSFELIENGISIFKLQSDCESIGKTEYKGETIEFEAKGKWWEKYKYNIIKNSKSIGSINFNWLLDSIISFNQDGLEEKFILKINTFKQEFNLYDENKTHLLRYKKTKGDFSTFEISCEILNQQKPTIELIELVIYSYYPAFLIMHGTLINQKNGGGV